jgi:Protein of unknown function (DUF3099)
VTVILQQSYGGAVKARHRYRREAAYVVTEARRSRTDDIAYRERRYLIMMAVRVVCFGVAVALFAAGAGWFAAIPAVGAIVIPYFAVVFANSGREPARTRGFRPYEPNLPAAYSPPPQGSTANSPGDHSPGGPPPDPAR